jgi:nucleoside-diphosphate-sugar epimerase
MRCLVTGASGHLGSYLTRLLLAEGHEVAIMVRSHSDLWRIADVVGATRVIHGDLSAMEQAAADIVAVAPETVFHLAWHGVGTDYRNDPTQIHQNLTGSVKLVEYARRAGCRCWIGVGSQAEHGRVEGSLHEDQPTKPVTMYGVTKLCAGMLTAQLCSTTSIRHVWCRLLATYGPKDDGNHFIPMVTRTLLAGEKPALTPGDQRWDYLYVEDAVDALYRLALQPRAEGVFILGSGESPSVRSMAQRIRDLIDPTLPLGFGELAYEHDQLMLLRGDPSKLRRATGWRPRVSMDDGLKRTVDWYRAHAVDRMP